MANYWDTFKPGLLAGEDYWEDFTPEAPTQTGVVGAVTGKRYQPWEKGYHKIAGLVDDRGEYDAWYDPDPPPETSRPDWATPEGYDNWKDRIALETGNTSSTGGQHLPEGGEGNPDQRAWTKSLGYHDSFGGTPWQDSPFASIGKKMGLNEVTNMTDTTATSGPFSSVSDLMGTIDISKAILGGFMAGPLGAIFGAVGGVSGIKDLLDGTHPALQGTETNTQGIEAGMTDPEMGAGDFSGEKDDEFY